MQAMWVSCAFFLLFIYFLWFCFVDKAKGAPSRRKSSLVNTACFTAMLWLYTQYVHISALKLRLLMQILFQCHYWRWCELNNFNSMLPNDAKKHKIIDQQPSVTDHFGPEDQVAKQVPYSDKALETASIKWLIQINQVCNFYCFLSCCLHAQI